MTTEHEVRIEKALDGDAASLRWARGEFEKAVSECTREVIRKSVGSAENDALHFLDPQGQASPDERGLLLASHRDPGLAEAYRVSVLRGLK